MAYDVFLSYARADTDRARQIKDLLEGLGLSVFFDTEGLDGGDVFPDVLDHAVKTSGAVVGVWSTHALTRPWVKIECDIGKTRGVLVPLQIEQIADLDRPAAFWNIQFADLSDFSGDANHTGWLRFVRSLARTLDRPDLLERESAAQAATPDSQDASVRAELAALRAEMADMRNAKERAAAAPVKQVEMTKTAPSTRSKAPLIAGGLLVTALIAGAFGWQIYSEQQVDEVETERTAIVTAPPMMAASNPSALSESDGVAYHVQACDNGITTGCMSAATAYAYGEGIELDRTIALSYYDRGCDLGDMEACWVGGIVYEQDGEYRVARALYDRACLGGAEDGCGLLKDLDEMAIADTQAAPPKPSWAQGLTDAKAIGHAEGCIDGDMLSCYNLGYSYQHARDLTRNYSEAKRLFTKACNGEEVSACSNLGYMYLSAQGVAQDYAKAKRLLTKACDGGNMIGCNSLGNMHDDAQGVTQDYSEARRLYTKACNGGTMNGCFNLGFMYLSARGVTQDYVEANRLFTKACDGGLSVSCDLRKSLDKMLDQTD